MFQQPDLFSELPSIKSDQHRPERARSTERTVAPVEPVSVVTTTSRRSSRVELSQRIASFSKRPRYTYMVLKLIAEAAGNKESAGPYIIADGVRQPIRDWLCDALMPLAERNPHRRNITNRIRTELEAQSLLPSDQDEAAAVIDNAVRAHVLRSAKCNVSTAVSDLVRAGLVRRHYQGYRVDHHNRGAQREAVYTLTKEARSMLSRSGWPH